MKRFKFALALTFGLTLALAAGISRAAEPQIAGAAVEYKDGDAVLEGYFVNLEGASEPRSAVLVVHQWKGLSDHEKGRAGQLAASGYTVLAADIYGKGIRPSTPAEAGKLAGQYKADRALLRRRVQAGLDYLKSRKEVDPARIAVIGYCFGGTAALEAARSGADLKGVVSFHGGLQAPVTAAKGEIKAKVLVCHGADDPHVKPAEVAAFEEEMRTSGADWQLISYGGAVHSFTDKKAGSDPTKGAAYQQAADERSWEAMLDFFREIFRKSGSTALK